MNQVPRKVVKFIGLDISKKGGKSFLKKNILRNNVFYARKVRLFFLLGLYHTGCLPGTDIQY